MRIKDRIAAQEEVWSTVMSIVGDYFWYHQRGPNEPCNNAQKLAVGHILRDLKMARVFGLAAIPRAALSQKGEG